MEEKRDALNSLGKHVPWLDVRKMDRLMTWNKFGMEAGSDKLFSINKILAMCFLNYCKYI